MKKLTVFFVAISIGFSSCSGRPLGSGSNKFPSQEANSNKEVLKGELEVAKQDSILFEKMKTFDSVYNSVEN